MKKKFGKGGIVPMEEKAPPGSGGRFKSLVGKLTKKGKSKEQAEGIAAKAGREKYGAKRMAQWAAKKKKG